MSVDDTAVAVRSITKWIDESEQNKPWQSEGYVDRELALKALRTAVEALEYEAEGETEGNPYCKDALASIRKELGITEETDHGR